MKNRIVRTFSIYVVLIIIPVATLLYQGFRSLRLHREQLESSLISQLEQARAQFRRDLFEKWRLFLEEERKRDYSHYQPTIFPDEGRFFFPEPGAMERSPLQLEPNHFAYLLESSAPSVSGQEGLIFKNSLIGYFEFDIHSQTFYTPYDQSTPFTNAKDTPKLLDRFRNFLNGVIQPSIRDELRLSGDGPVNVRGLLLNLKMRRYQKTYVRADRAIELDRLRGLPPQIRPGTRSSSNLEVSYYDFKFDTLNQSEGKYIYGFRTVIIHDDVRIQGFVFDVLRLLQEIQSMIEPLQPEFGSLVIAAFDSRSGAPLFEPFNVLTMDFNLNEDETYLESYYAERQRFFLTMAFLFVALIASTIHMTRLLTAENQLAAKKNDFVSAVTHELKAPLTSIRLYAELLEEGWAKGKEMKYYRYIHSETIRLARLVTNILDFARLERGEFKLNPKPIKLHTFIKETVESWRFWLEENGFRIHYDFRGSPSINADPDSLIQIVYNLCDNALKYGHSAETPTIYVIIDETDDEAILIIHDNGAGVKKEEEEKVFQRFFRGEDEMTRENTGTGLGLALVEELVTKNEATMKIYYPTAHSGFGIQFTFPKLLAQTDDDA